MVGKLTPVLMLGHHTWPRSPRQSLGFKEEPGIFTSHSHTAHLSSLLLHLEIERELLRQPRFPSHGAVKFIIPSLSAVRFTAEAIREIRVKHEPRERH